MHRQSINLSILHKENVYQTQKKTRSHGRMMTCISQRKGNGMGNTLRQPGTALLLRHSSKRKRAKEKLAGQKQTWRTAEEERNQ
jgi:hypothetical protein